MDNPLSSQSQLWLTSKSEIALIRCITEYRECLYTRIHAEKSKRRIA